MFHSPSKTRRALCMRQHEILLILYGLCHFELAPNNVVVLNPTTSGA